MIRHLLRRHRPGHAYPDGGQRNRRIRVPAATPHPAEGLLPGRPLRNPVSSAPGLQPARAGVGDQQHRLGSGLGRQVAEAEGSQNRAEPESLLSRIGSGHLRGIALREPSPLRHIKVTSAAVVTGCITTEKYDCNSRVGQQMAAAKGRRLNLGPHQIRRSCSVHAL